MKKRLLLLLLACALTLSGCSLVVKDPVVDMGRTVIDVRGEVVTKGQLMDAYGNLYNYALQQQQFAQMFNQQPQQINPQQLLAQAVQGMTQRLVLGQKAKELKLDELTEPEKEDYEKQVDTSFQQLLDQVKAQHFADTKLEGEELQKELIHKAEDLGTTREQVAEGVLGNFLADKLEKLTTKDVAVPEEEVRADYDQKVAADKERFDADPDAYGQQVNARGTVYYAPPGYRHVKQILVKFLSEDQEKLSPLQAAERTAQTALDQAKAAVTANENALKAEDLKDEDKQALTDKAAELKKAQEDAQAAFDDAAKALKEAQDLAYANIHDKAFGIYERTKTEDFDTLAKEFNEDAGTPEAGYAVRKGFANFDSAFVVPAMALQNVGDVAEPSPGVYGYYIVQYAASVEAGPVNYDSVHEGLHQALLTTKKNSFWQDELTRWTEEAGVKTYLERLSD